MLQNEWKNPKTIPELYTKILILLKDKTVRYGYYGAKGWWIYSNSNGFIIELNRNVIGWKELQ